MATGQENTTQVGTGLSTELKAVFDVEHFGQKRTLLVKKDRIVFGSVESADVRLEGSKIAPIHAFMEITWGMTEGACTARIIDLASPAGVTINGKRIVNEAVKPGDLVGIGDAIVKFNFKKPDAAKDLPNQTLILIDANDITPIFDYRSTTKEALEVVYSWNSVILNVKHFIGQESVTLGGTAQDDFLVPSVFASGTTSGLATRSGSDWAVNLDPKMSGVIYLRGELISVEEQRKKGPAVVLGQNDFIKLESGGVAFYLSQTVAPPVLKNHGNIISDPFLAKSLVSSILFTALIVGTLYFMDPPKEQEKVPETVATILYHPEKYSIKHKLPEPPKPKPVEEVKKPEPPQPERPKKAEVDFTKPKVEQKKPAMTKSAQPGQKSKAESEAKEGAGARAKGEEGSRGAKNAHPADTHKTAANRPSPQAGAGRGGTDSQVQDNGNVQLLKGQTNKILDLLGGSGQKLDKSGSKLSGFGGFSTQGNGGAALEGSGKGGGGNADTLLGGLSDHGRGGGKVGTGLGAEGTGAGIVGGKTRVELNAGGGDETVVVGSIDRDAIDAAIKAHRDEFRYCYEREVNAGNPGISGKIVTAFVIGGSGRASQLSIASSSMGAPNVERCVLGVLTRIQFPQPAGGVPVTIKYPFAFSNASK